MLLLMFAYIVANVNAKDNPSDIMDKGFAQVAAVKDDEKQKDSLKTDYLEFDGPNAVKAFRKTCSDGVVIEGINYSESHDFDGIHYLRGFFITITYPDGTIFLYDDSLRHLSVTSSFKEAIYSLKNVPDFYDVKILLDPRGTMDLRSISSREDNEEWIPGTKG